MMMKLNPTCSFVFVVAAIVGCAIGSGFAAPNENRPDDFSILYEVKSGSVPAPYYNEVTISIPSSGQGTITLTPDYPADSVPKWAESFDLDAQKLDQLYSLLVTEQALALNWREPSPPKLGAPSKMIRITANGKQMEIPPQVAGEQYKAKKKITEAINALVPESLWKNLKERHVAYAKEHYPSGAE